MKVAGFAVLAVCLAVVSCRDTLQIQREGRQREAERRAVLSPPQDAETLRDKLRADPLQAEALRNLATSGGRRDLDLLHLSERVSRRDPVTQLILLDAAARAGDLNRTLSHYDVLLSTTPQVASALSAQLTSAVGNEEVASQLYRYGDREWFIAFLSAAASSAPDPRSVADLVKKTRQLSDPAAAKRLGPPLLQSLVKAGHIADAFDLVGAIAQGSKDWRVFHFSEATLNWRMAPLTWTLLASPQARAEYTAPGAVAVTVAPLVQAQVLRRITGLAPGRYRLDQTVTYPSAPSATLQWRLKCLHGASASQPVWQHRMSGGVQAGSSASEITIPAECQYQEWTLTALGDDAQTASKAELKDLQLSAL